MKIKKLISVFLCSLYFSPLMAGINSSGVDQYLDFGDDADFENTSMSISFWIKMNSSPAIYDGVMAKTNGGSWSEGWGIYWNGSSTLVMFTGSYTNLAGGNCTSTDWNHYAWTLDGITVRCYVNGTSAGTAAQSSIDTANPFEIFRVGQDFYNIDGILDDVRFYSRTLDAQEIESIAKSRSRLNITDSLFSYFRFDDKSDGAFVSNNQIRDYGTAGKNPTVNSVPVWSAGMLSYP